MDINPGELDLTRGNKVLGESDADVAGLDSSNGFDCNICLDISRDPVVTLCGHLYCWPCIYKWFQSHSSSQQCPVCKSSVSQATLVPLYGRGLDAPSRGKRGQPNVDIPHRPRPAYRRAHILNELPNRGQHRLPHRRSYYRDDYLSTPQHGFDLRMTHVIHPVDGSLGELAMATLPWLLGNRNVGLYYPNSFNLMGGGIDHQEHQARRMLSRILAFLSCFALLCFLVF